MRISLGYPCGKDVITSLWTYRYTATFQLENYIYCLIKLFSFSCNLCILFLFLCFSTTITVSILLYHVNCDALKSIKTTPCVLVIPERYSSEQQCGRVGQCDRPWCPETTSDGTLEDGLWNPCGNFSHTWNQRLSAQCGSGVCLPEEVTPGGTTCDMSAKQRGTAKGLVTKALRTLKRNVSEYNHDAVVKQLEVLKSTFDDFEAVHYQYHDSLSDEEEIKNSDAYYNLIEAEYIEVVSKANKWLIDSAAAEVPSDHDSSLSALCAYMSMPSISIDSFSGDPLLYKSFMSVFDETVHSKPVDDSLKLSRLLQFTEGEAKSSIRHCAIVGGSSGYQQARKILASRFGNGHLIAQRVIDNLKSGKPVVTPSDLQQLADDLSMASASLKSLNLFTELSNQRSIVDILHRCPSYVSSKWQRKALEKKADSGSYPTFDDFVKFIQGKAAESLDPIYGTDAMKPRSSKSDERGFNGNLSGNHYGGQNMPPCVLCKSPHTLFHCELFKAKKPVDRVALVRQHGLCFLCLQAGHNHLNCNKRYTCSVPGCGKRHTKFLHIDDQRFRGGTGNGNNTGNGAQGNTNGQNSTDANVGNANATSCNIYLPMIPIRINDDPRTFYCLLDSGSTNTLVDQSLVSILNLETNHVRYNVNSVSGKSRINKAVNVKISDLDGSQAVKLSNVLVVPDIPANLPEIKIDAARYPHLADLPLHVNSENVKASILIGLDNAHILLPHKVRCNPRGRNEPYATRTLLGWALSGPMDNIAPASMAAQVCATQLCNFQKSRDSIEDHVENLWKIEVNESRDQAHSYIDKQIHDMWERDTKLIDGHYHVPIPFRNSELDFPDNLSMVKRRLYLQKKRLDNTGLFDRYSEGIKQFIDKGFAERVPEDEISLDDGSV